MNRLVALLSMLCIACVAVAHARQGTSPVVPRPLVPAAASSIAADPDAFYGQTVTVTAAVDQILSPTSFIVDQDPKKASEGVLVLVNVLNDALAVNSYVTVIGEVVRHEGRPAIRAASVLNSAMVDIAKRLPPPMTPDEEVLDKAMKRISPAFNALRQAVTAGGSETAKEDAAALRAGFSDTESFWKKRETADAQKWAADARAQSDVIAQAIAGGKWDEAKAAIGSLQQTCSACHSAYRQRLDDGSYRVRTEK